MLVVPPDEAKTRRERMREKVSSTRHVHAEGAPCAVCEAIAAKKEEEERAKEVAGMLSGGAGGHGEEGKTGSTDEDEDEGGLAGAEQQARDSRLEREDGRPGPLGLVVVSERQRGVVHGDEMLRSIAMGVPMPGRRKRLQAAEARPGPGPGSADSPRQLPLGGAHGKALPQQQQGRATHPLDWRDSSAVPASELEYPASTQRSLRSGVASRSSSERAIDRNGLAALQHYRSSANESLSKSRGQGEDRRLSHTRSDSRSSSRGASVFRASSLSGRSMKRRLEAVKHSRD